MESTYTKTINLIEGLKKTGDIDSIRCANKLECYVKTELFSSIGFDNTYIEGIDLLFAHVMLEAVD